MTGPDRDSEAVEQLRRYANHLRSQVDGQAALAAARRALAARPHRAPRRRWAVGLAVAGLMAVSSVGLATVADDAVPGDLLYPIDRGLEWLGDVLGNADHIDERISESEALAHRGDTAAALEHLSSSVGTLDALDPASGIDLSAVLDQARSAVAATGPAGNQAQVEDEVDDLVEATKGVAEAARAGDEEALRAAIEAMRDFAERVKDAARADLPGQSGPEDTPGATAPGRDNNPGVTAPGRDNGRGSSEADNQGTGNNQP